MLWLSRNEAMEATVRSAVRKQYADPDAIRVRASHGRVTLRGDVAAEDEHRLLTAVYSVPGVREILNRLDPHPRTALSEQGSDPTSMPATA